MAEEQTQMSDSEKKKEDWMNSKWRPMMGWMYMAVCAFDFMIAPVLWSITQAVFHGGVNVQWQPLTLQGAGLFHVAMGAVLGLAAYGRTQEKLAGANNGGLQPTGTTYTPPAPIQATVPSFGGTSNGGFGSTTGSATPVASGFGGSGAGSAPATPASTTSGFGSSAGFGAGTTTTAPTITTAPPAFGSKPTGPAQSFPAL
jgi:Holin of 3TMs, for gene-transfer release